MLGVQKVFQFWYSFIQGFVIIYLKTLVRQLSEMSEKYSFFLGWYCLSQDQTIEKTVL